MKERIERKRKEKSGKTKNDFQRPWKDTENSESKSQANN